MFFTGQDGRIERRGAKKTTKGVAMHNTLITVQLFANTHHLEEYQEYRELARLSTLDNDACTDVLDALGFARTFILDTFVSTSSPWLQDYAVKAESEPVALSKFCADAVQFAMSTAVKEDDNPGNELVEAHNGYFSGLSRFIEETQPKKNAQQTTELSHLFCLISDHHLERTGKALIVFSTPEIVEENIPHLAKISS